MYEVKGKSLGYNYIIMDALGNEVANVDMLYKGKTLIEKGLSKEKYGLRINDVYVGKVDARQLVGFVITIEDNLRD